MSVTEILGTIQDGSLQVCATADGDYDHAEQRVAVALDAFTRRTVASEDGAQLPQPWLPRREIVREHLAREEADEFVKDVFHRWVEKVRASVPQDLPLRP